jgi:hypothetical protein
MGSCVFFGVCGVLFKVLSRSVFSFSRRVSQDETVYCGLSLYRVCSKFVLRIDVPGIRTPLLRTTDRGVGVITPM